MNYERLAYTQIIVFVLCVLVGLAKGGTIGQFLLMYCSASIFQILFEVTGLKSFFKL